MSVDETITLVSVALGTADVGGCSAGDLNLDGMITVEEILSAVADALGGCTPVIDSTWIRVDTTINVQDVWGASATDIFAVASEGIIRHFDGNSWTGMSSGTTQYLEGVWGFGSSDVYAVGFNPQSFSNPTVQRGIILHYDGVAWSEVQHGQTDTFFLDVWGSDPNDVFVVGGREGFSTPGVILHYDGSRWTQQLLVNDSAPHNQLRGVWGFTADDVYAVGSGEQSFEDNPGMPALAFHYDGDSWRRIASINGVFNNVWGWAPNDLYASGGPTGLAHYDGERWSAIASELFGAGSAAPIWGFGPNDIFFGLIYYDGSELVNTRRPESLLFSVMGLWGPPDGRIIYGAAPNGVWKLER